MGKEDNETFRDEEVAIDEVVTDDGEVVKTEVEEVDTEEGSTTEEEQAAEIEAEQPEPRKVVTTSKTESPEKVKKCRTTCWPAVVILALLAITAAGFGAWAMWSNQGKISKLEGEIEAKNKVIVELGGEIAEEEEKPNEQPVDSGWKSMALTRGKWINPPEGSHDGLHVVLTSKWSGSVPLTVTVAYGATMLECGDEEVSGGQINKAYLTVDFAKLREFYHIENGSQYLEGNTVLTDIEIEGIDAAQVVDVRAASFGQAVGYETILFQMADGSIEYIPVMKMAMDGKVKSYGKIPGVANVVRLMESKNGTTYISAPVCFGGGMDVFAQRNDGKFYTLYPLLEATGNYY